MYTKAKITLSIGDISIDSLSIVQMTIDKDYFRTIYPYIRLLINFQPSEIIELSKMTNIKANLILNEVTFKNKDDEIPIKINQAIKLTFDVIFTTDIESLDLDSDKDPEIELDAMNGKILVELSLVNINMINNLKKQQMTKIYTNTMLATILLDLLSDFNNYIITPPLLSKLEDVYVPSEYDIKETILFLNNEYGLYNSTPIVFMDIDILYLLNPVDINIIMKKKDNKYGDIIFKDIEMVESDESIGYYIEDDIINMYYYDLNYPTNNELSSYTDGNTLISISSDRNIRTNTIEASSSSKKKITVRSDNPYVLETIKNDLLLKKRSVYITAMNVPFTYLNPCKKYRIDSIDKNLEGTHFPKFITTTLSEVDENGYFKIQSDITLMKIK